MGPEIHLLGIPRLLRNGVALPAPRGHKTWGVLAYLARHRGGVSRAQLAGLLFEEAEDPLAALRWNLAELRRVLGDVGLRGDIVDLVPGRILYIDLDVVTHGAWPEALGVPGLGQELLEGMNFPSSPSFDVWLATERRHMQATAEAVLREAALTRLAAGHAHEAADLAARLVRLNPLDENFQALLVRSLAAAGDGVGAARQAAACTELFLRELGVRPGATLSAAMHTVTSAATARPLTGRAGAIAQLKAGEAAIGAGVLDAGLECLRRSIVESDGSGDPELRMRARVALGAALVHSARGRDEEGATALHEALAIAKGEASPIAAAACRELGYVEFLRGRYDRALAWLDRAAPLVGSDYSEQARAATLRGAILSDTAHYAASLAMLSEAEAMADRMGDSKQLAYVLSLRGRALMLCGELTDACDALDRSVTLAQRVWTALLPWPQALRAEVDLQRGSVDSAAENFEQAFALGCQLGDPCWEGIASRGLGKVAMARGSTQGAVEILLDSVQRSQRLPDGYVWGKGYALEVLCGLAVERHLTQAPDWIDQLLTLSGRAGMRELTVRAYLHRARLGDSASADAARLLAAQIENPRLRSEMG